MSQLEVEMEKRDASLPEVSDYTRGRLDALKELEDELCNAVVLESHDSFEGPSQRPIIDLYRVMQIFSEARKR